MARRIKNTGSIFYRSNRDIWVFQIPLHLIKDKKTISAKTKKELTKKIEEFYKEIDEVKFKQENRTIVDLLHEYENDKLKKNIITAGTHIRNIATISRIEENYIGKIPIQNITIKDLNDFSNTLINYSNSVISKIFIQLKKGFQLGLEKELITKDLVKSIIKPKSNIKTKKVSAFTLEEQKEFIRLIPSSKYYMQYLIALNTGMRIGEVNALHIDDIDFINKTIKINKTVARDENYKEFIKLNTKTEAGMRTVPINEILYEPLKEYCNDKLGYIFSFNRVISAPMVNSEMKRLCEKSKLIKQSVNTHMLRHTFATRCIESGMPAVVLSKILGHTDISTTLNTYTDVFNEYKQEHFEHATEYFKKLY